MNHKNDIAISVIVPIYNVENYLIRCIDSILNQTFSNFELILVDDGSTDACGRICDEYALTDNRITVLHINNGGVSNARNKGLDLAKGKYIIFCDSDDYWKINLLEITYNYLINSDVDYLLFNYDNIENNKTLYSSNHETGLFYTSQLVDKFEYIVKFILTGNSGWEVWTRIFKNDIIQKNKIRFCLSCNNFAEDMGFVINYIYYSKTVLSIPNSLYCYCIRNNSMMQKSFDKVRLNDLNEISYDVGIRYNQVFTYREYQSYYPMIHFLIMYNQYCKIISTDRYNTLPKEISNIKRKKWYFKNTVMLFKARKVMYDYFGIQNTKRIFLLNHYCLYRNWKLFTYESAIFYKFFYKDSKMTNEKTLRK